MQLDFDCEIRNLFIFVSNEKNLPPYIAAQQISPQYIDPRYIEEGEEFEEDCDIDDNDQDIHGAYGQGAHCQLDVVLFILCVRD